MVRHSLQILAQDGYDRAYQGLMPYIDTLAKGSGDADLPWTWGYILHFYHYHHPWSHRGYITKKGGAEVVQDIFWQSVRLWSQGRPRQALYQLGRSIHVLQDMFVPHHAGLTARRNHGDYERYVTHQWRRFAPQQGGHYQWHHSFYLPLCGTIHRLSWERPFDWVDVGAHLSLPWLDALDGATCPHYHDRFHDATQRLIPDLLRFTAGYLYRFCCQVGMD